MRPEQRRGWVRMILGHADLTSAAKTVLLALETFADYRDGTNAHPGEENLAAMTGLSTRAVRTALDRGRGLGVIIRTSPANPKAGRAAVYQLGLGDPNTGSPVPVEKSSTGTAVPVNNTHTTGSTVPVEPVSTGTAIPHHRNGDVISTGTTVPPTLHAPSNHQSVVNISGGRVTSVGANGPRPHCHLHEENDDGPCRHCKRRRKWEEANPGWRERDEVERRRQLRAIADNCPRCHGTGTYTVGENLSAKCDPHLTPEEFAHA